MSTENTNSHLVPSFCGITARQLGLSAPMCLRANFLAIAGERLKEQAGVYVLDPPIEVTDNLSKKLNGVAVKYLADLNSGDKGIAKVQAKGAELIKACKGAGPGTLHKSPTEAFRGVFPSTAGKLTDQDLADIDEA